MRAEPKRAVPGAPRARPRALASIPWAPGGWLALALLVAVALVVGLAHTSSAERVIAASLGAARIRISGNHGDLVIDRLAPLPAERVYELWLQAAGAPTPTPSTLFAVTSRGRANLGVPGALRGLTRLLVTVEPAGGSMLPSTRPVIVAPLA